VTIGETALGLQRPVEDVRANVYREGTSISELRAAREVDRGVQNRVAFWSIDWR
jgi:hypothetical protein